MASTESKRLDVVIVGAGIAGLAAGVMLREWANVIIVESAHELSEVGAALTLSPGAVKILRRFNIQLENEGGVAITHSSVWTSSGKEVNFAPFHAIEKAGDVNLSVHRADLHAALVRSATTVDGPGAPCKILLEHVVTKVDVDHGVITVANGSEFKADVVIAADGVRSVVRPFVVDEAPTPLPSGESTYRFLLHPEDLQAINSPILKDGKIPPYLYTVLGQQRRLLLYPCRGGEVFNCGAIVPDSELHEAASQKWKTKGDVNALLKSYKDFDPMWTDILRLAKDVGLWQLRDLNPLPTWVKGRTILIGDAAHPMLPHRAAGGMSAIEDAEALAIHLSAISSEFDAATIHEALQHVFRVRYKRASKCQAQSRAAGLMSTADNSKRADEFMELWMYPGVERWEAENPDMILSK